MSWVSVAAVPLLLMRAPAELMPVPEIWMISVGSRVWPSRSSSAPLATPAPPTMVRELLPALPRAVALPTWRMPALIETVPVKVLAPERRAVAVVVLVRPTLPARMALAVPLRMS